MTWVNNVAFPVIFRGLRSGGLGVGWCFIQDSLSLQGTAISSFQIDNWRCRRNLGFTCMLVCFWCVCVCVLLFAFVFLCSFVFLKELSGSQFSKWSSVQRKLLFICSIALFSCFKYIKTVSRFADCPGVQNDHCCKATSVYASYGSFRPSHVKYTELFFFFLSFIFRVRALLFLKFHSFTWLSVLSWFDLHAYG